MRKILLFSVFVLAAFFGIAQSRQYPLAIGAGVNFPDYRGARSSFGEYFTDAYWEHKGIPIRISFGVNLNSSFNLELSGNFGKGDNVLPEQQYDETIGLVSYWDVDLNLQYRFANGYMLKETCWWDPYLFIGPQVSGIDDKTYFAFDGGLGMNFWVQKHVALFGSAAYDVTIDGPGYYHFAFGLKYRFHPGKDTDKDGIKDKKDKCIEQPGPAIYEGCPDTDGDSIPDIKDKCPTVKGPLKYEGCPDTDGDGIIDKDDACPDAAGLPEFNGCPDRDGDGIIDKEDKCPDVKGIKSMQGCPDTDGDGITDLEDKCPNEKGPASNNGCPLPPPKPEINFATLVVYYGFDKAKLTDEYKAKLDDAAKVMAEFPEAKFMINGHADNIGDDGYNMKLSEHRAKQVLDYLVSKGIDASRFVMKGFGESQPAAPNKTADGRAKNRRAEVILQK